MDDEQTEVPPPSDVDARTPAWYSTRAVFTIAIGAVLVVGWSILFAPASFGGGPREPWEPLLPLAGFLGMVIGLVWMIRIFRGPRDEPPPWRYRDR